MAVIKFILHIIGWLVTILLQIALSFLIIFLFSVFFADVGSSSRLGWLALLFVIWLAYVIGINLVGALALRWAWKGLQHLPTLRLFGTAIGALIPLLILLVIGYSLPVGSAGTRFYDLVTNNWQPVLTQTSLFAAIVGYYLPGMFRSKS
jgi:hypothetical protein